MIASLQEEKKKDEKDEETCVMECLIKAYFNNICKLSSNGCYVPVNLLTEEGTNEGNVEVLLHEDCILRFTSIVNIKILELMYSLLHGFYLKIFN